jgi:hypothetical protein
MHDDVLEAASRRETKAFFKVFTTMPTTAAGVAALLTWLAEPEHSEGASRVSVIGEFDEWLGEDAARQLLACAAVLM